MVGVLRHTEKPAGFRPVRDLRAPDQGQCAGSVKFGKKRLEFSTRGVHSSRRRRGRPVLPRESQGLRIIEGGLQRSRQERPRVESGGGAPT